jgi:hypothetical protein
MRKESLCLLASAPLGLLLWASAAFAQTTGVVVGVVTDALTGKPVSGAEVVATSPTLQGKQTAKTDETGGFRLMLLPPGRYKLEAQREGYRPAERGDVTLRVDKTLRADLAMLPEAVEMEEQVVRTGVAPVIDVGSAETGFVATKEFMSLVPMARSFEDAEKFAPGAQRDKFGFGFAGAQSPENNYLIDGLNVTDPRFGTLGTNFLPNFFEEVDVKTGAFMPEYGRSTGGIVSGVLKSGSNEYHGSVWVNWTPRFLLEPDGHSAGRAGEAIWSRTTPRHDGLTGGAYDLDAGFEVGGPILKDRLWYYVGFAPVFQRTITDRYLRATQVDQSGAPVTDSSGNFIQQDISGTDQYYATTTKQFQTVAKLTYLFDENHNVSLSALWAPKDVKGFNANDAQDMNGEPSTFLSERWSESMDFTGRYAGKFWDKHLVIEASAGAHYQYSEDRPGIIDGVDQGATPFTRWQALTPLSPNFENVPGCTAQADSTCLVNRYTTGGYGPMESATLRRFGGRLSASYLLSASGVHNVKGGLDVETTDFHELNANSGGADFLYLGRNLFVVDSYGTVGPDGTPIFASGTDTRSRAVSQAYYLQDSWQVLNSGLTLNYGVRWELQSLNDAKRNQTNISINDNIAPRVQAIYDFTGQGRGKIAANWGRFYENIPLHVGDRAFGGVTFADGVYACNPVSPSKAPFDPRTAPGCSLLPPGYQQFGGSTDAVAPDLKGMYVDQFGLAAEYEVLPDLSIGVEWQARRLGRAIEDISDDGQNFFVANPGESKPWSAGGQTYNSQQATTIDPATGRTVTVPLPKPQRDYDGFTVRMTKNLSRNWLAQASYTYSILRGNYEGFFRPEKELPTPTPNLTSDYDVPSLMQNKTGLLPGDITHQFKLFGAYVFRVTPKLNITAGGAFTAQSGTPLNVLGSYPGAGRAETFIVQRGEAGRSPAVTQLDLKGQLDYLFSPPYTLKLTVEVFNVFNSQTGLDVDQNYTFDYVQPIPGARCANRNGANAANPIAGVQADCADLRNLKTIDGRPVTVNPNYGKPLGSSASFQLPVSMRIGAALTF